MRNFRRWIWWAIQFADAAIWNACRKFTSTTSIIMKTTAYRGTDKLAPKFKEKVEKWIAEVNKKSEVIFITETWRSEERQKELIAAKLSQVARSNHQDWLAVDIAFRWDELYPSDSKQWRTIADIAKKYGIDWGFDLWKWDRPHFQDNWKPLLTIINPEVKKTRYTDIMTQALKEANLTPLFSSHEWAAPLTEQEVKELIEIAFARAAKRK